MTVKTKLRRILARSCPKPLRRFVPEFVFQHIHFKGTFPVYWRKKRIGFLLSHNSLIENKIFWRGITKSDEGKSLEIFLNFVEIMQPKLILDIGANTGVYGVLAKLINKESEVHFFDPIVGCLDAIQSNLSLNKTSGIINHVALSNYDGSGQIYMDKNKSMTYTVTLNVNREPKNEQFVKASTPVLTYFSYAKQKAIGIPDLVKIDVETHENEVLQGFGTLLSPQTSFLIEILSEEAARNLEKLLPNSHYDYWNIDDQKRVVKKQNHLSSSLYYNFFVCPPEVSSKLGISKMTH